VIYYCGFVIRLCGPDEIAPDEIAPDEIAPDEIAAASHGVNFY